MFNRLHLFGYELPRTNNRYFLASSFTDLWRRINIYWMEYMRKMIYYPVAVRTRRLGEAGSSRITRVITLSVEAPSKGGAPVNSA